MWPEKKTPQSWRGRHNLKVGKGLKNHLLQIPSFPDEGNEAASWREWSRFVKHTSDSSRLSCCSLSLKTPQVWLSSVSPLPSPNCVLFLFQNEVAYSTISISFLNPDHPLFLYKSNHFHSSSPEHTFICAFGCVSPLTLMLFLLWEPSYSCAWLSPAELAIISGSP